MPASVAGSCESVQSLSSSLVRSPASSPQEVFALVLPVSSLFVYQKEWQRSFGG